MMTMLTVLEVGNLDGLLVIIVVFFAMVAFLVSLFIALIAKLIYESRNSKKFTRGKFWNTVLISMLIAGLISGIICG